MLDRERSFTIPPVINPIAPKNQEFSVSRRSWAFSALRASNPTESRATSLLDGHAAEPGGQARRDGGGGLLGPAAGDFPGSAWNRLKDPAGVVRMFAEFVAPESPAHPVLAGPAVKWIPAETEAEAVYNETSRVSVSSPRRFASAFTSSPSPTTIRRRRRRS